MSQFNIFNKIMSLASCETFTKNALSQASNEFGMNVLNAITAAQNGNQVISPLSLTTALGMVHLGAKGETNDELRQLLAYNAYNIADCEAHNAYKKIFEQIRGANASRYVLNVANRVMAQNDFEILTDYSNSLQINYDASIQEVDFVKNGENAIKTVNNWVLDKTIGKIPSLLSVPLSLDTKLVIVNAVYFKGKWFYKFDTINTMDETFNNNGNIKATVKMMRSFNTKYKFTASEELDADILEMRYIGGDISMYIVLPRELNGLQKTASLLTEKKLNSAIKSMKNFRFDLYLPKFKIRKWYTLVGELKSLGLVNIFTEKADLSGINGHRNLFVSDVIHQVFLEVNEEGSVAAASNGVREIEYSLGGSQPKLPRVFKVDHPFIFVIRDNRNNMNIFFGQIIQL